MHNKKQVQENLSPVFEEPKYGLSCGKMENAHLKTTVFQVHI